MNSADKTIQIRPCSTGDIAVVAEIYERAVRSGVATFDIAPPDVKAMTKRHAAIEEAGYPYLVATIGGVVAGYAYVNAYRPRPAYAYTVENSVYVAENCQRRGVGLALMHRLIADSAARGYRQMIAVIGDSGNLASKRLHEALGFRIVGIEFSVGWKHGRWLDAVTMQLPIGAGDSVPPIFKP